MSKYQISVLSIYLPTVTAYYQVDHLLICVQSRKFCGVYEFISTNNTCLTPCAMWALFFFAFNLARIWSRKLSAWKRIHFVPSCTILVISTLSLSHVFSHSAYPPRLIWHTYGFFIEKSRHRELLHLSSKHIFVPAQTSPFIFFNEDRFIDIIKYEMFLIPFRINLIHLLDDSSK